jgi:quercetin dioxygenase-like cupin family protein
LDAFDLPELAAARAASGSLYHEFIRVPALSGGLYVLPAGAADPQRPHAEDEVYVIMSGRATITVAGEERAVRPGSIVYVPARVPHHFHSITEELEALVLFAPAETGPAETGPAGTEG